MLHVNRFSVYIKLWYTFDVDFSHISNLEKFSYIHDSEKYDIFEVTNEETLRIICQL